jgi:hypothetical protein
MSRFPVHGEAPRSGGGAVVAWAKEIKEPLQSLRDSFPTSGEATGAQASTCRFPVHGEAPRSGGGAVVAWAKEIKEPLQSLRDSFPTSGEAIGAQSSTCRFPACGEAPRSGGGVASQGRCMIDSPLQSLRDSFPASRAAKAPLTTLQSKPRQHQGALTYRHARSPRQSSSTLPVVLAPTSLARTARRSVKWC